MRENNNKIKKKIILKNKIIFMAYKINRMETIKKNKLSNNNMKQILVNI